MGRFRGSIRAMASPVCWASASGAIPKEDQRSRWITDKQQRLEISKTCVAVADKNARIMWALIVRNESYQKTAYERSSNEVLESPTMARSRRGARSPSGPRSRELFSVRGRIYARVSLPPRREAEGSCRRDGSIYARPERAPRPLSCSQAPSTTMFHDRNIYCSASGSGLWRATGLGLSAPA